MHGTIVNGTALDAETLWSLGFAENFLPEKTVPIFFRLLDKPEPNVEFNFFPVGLETATSIFGFKDCRTEIELLAKINGSG
jgi:hypothetical protein